MYGDIFRSEPQNPIKRPGKPFAGIGRKPGDQVHIDAVKPFAPRHLICLQQLRRCVPAPDLPKYPLFERLRIDADAVRTVGSDRPQFFRSNGVRTPRLHGIFPKAAQIKQIRDRIHQPRELLGCEAGRGAAAKIDRPQPQPQFGNNPRKIGQFLTEPVEIGGDQLCRPTYRM